MEGGEEEEMEGGGDEGMGGGREGEGGGEGDGECVFVVGECLSGVVLAEVQI